MQRQLVIWRELQRVESEILSTAHPGDRLYALTAEIMSIQGEQIEMLERRIAASREHAAETDSEKRPACFYVASLFGDEGLSEDEAAAAHQRTIRRLQVQQCLATMPIHYPAAFARAKALKPAIEFDVDNPDLDLDEDAGVVRQAFIDSGILKVGTSAAANPTPNTSNSQASAAAIAGAERFLLAPRVDDQKAVAASVRTPEVRRDVAARPEKPAGESYAVKTRQGMTNVFGTFIALAFMIVVASIGIGVLRSLGGFIVDRVGRTREQPVVVIAGAPAARPLTWWRRMLVDWLSGTGSRRR